MMIYHSQENTVELYGNKPHKFVFTNMTPEEKEAVKLFVCAETTTGKIKKPICA
jgi:hypothetical protein